MVNWERKMPRVPELLGFRARLRKVRVNQHLHYRTQSQFANPVEATGLAAGLERGLRWTAKWMYSAKRPPEAVVYNNWRYAVKLR